MKAPVGPPICTRLPPKNETINPPITAVINPFSGETPDAIPNAIANGSAIIPTKTPAVMSLISCSLVTEESNTNNLGLNINTSFEDM